MDGKMHKTRLLDGKFVLVFCDSSTNVQSDIYLKNIHPLQFTTRITDGTGIKQDVKSIDDILALVNKEYPNLYFTGIAVLEHVEYITVIPADQYEIIENLNSC